VGLGFADSSTAILEGAAGLEGGSRDKMRMPWQQGDAVG